MSDYEKLIVYVFRHGEAETKGKSPDKTEEGRRLTAEGREQVERVCDEAKKLEAKPSVIISSPLVRAKQTAEIAKKVFNSKPGVMIDSCLEPEAKLEQVYRVLGKLNKKDEVVLVTHYPLIGRLASDFINWKDNWTNLELQNGAIMKVESSKTLPRKGSGIMTWLLPRM